MASFYIGWVPSTNAHFWRRAYRAQRYYATMLLKLAICCTSELFVRCQQGKDECYGQISVSYSLTSYTIILYKASEASIWVLNDNQKIDRTVNAQNQRHFRDHAVCDTYDIILLVLLKQGKRKTRQIIKDCDQREICAIGKCTQNKEQICVTVINYTLLIVIGRKSFLFNYANKYKFE